MTTPFLKWAGGKRWLASSGLLPVPQEFKRYIEPFLGGGAVFFRLCPDVAILSDVNAELIGLYCVIRDAPSELEDLMVQHQRRHSRDYYYDVRADLPIDVVARAARTLYLNRTCFNGLYRVNLRGAFNVPIGTKNAVIIEGESFADLSRALKGVEILCQDFEDTLRVATEGDFVFVDPPYTVKHNLNGFVKYNEKIFSWSDQIRLRDAVVAAVGRGASVVVTNADHESVRELYSGFVYQKLHRASVLASAPGKRGTTTEAMFVANLG